MPIWFTEVSSMFQYIPGNVAAKEIISNSKTNANERCVIAGFNVHKIFAKES